jgi:hypothetical protein
VARRSERGDTLDTTAEILVTAGDVSERDNAALALATSQIVTAFAPLYNAAMIDADEFMHVVYRFAGEQLPASPANPDESIATAGIANGGNSNVKTDAETGVTRTKGAD